MARKIISMANDGAVKAKAMAVPTNGAEHGVASIVANAPDAISCQPPVPVVSLPDQRRAKSGTGNITRSIIISANPAISTIMIPRKTGFWNCIPQPMARPADRMESKPPPSTINDRIMPAADIRKDRLICIGLASLCLSMLVSFSDKTGKTHGMMLRISPPRKANNRIGKSAANIDPAAPFSMLICCSIRKSG